MNDLFFVPSSSFSHHNHDHRVIEVPDEGGANMDEFFTEVESLKAELKEVERLKQSLKNSHEESKTLHNANAVKDLRSTMEADVALALKKAKRVKLQSEALQQSNAAHRSLPGCGAGSSSDRTRTSLVNALKKNLKDSVDGFNELRQQINSEYRETVQRRYFTVTGENPDEETVDLLISTGESECFLEKAIEKQGRGKIEETIEEIKERHEGVKELEKNLEELHQVFLDMAVLIHSQGEQLEEIERHVARANSFVSRGVGQLQTARKQQNNSRKCIRCVVIPLLLVVFLLLLFTVRPWQHPATH